MNNRIIASALVAALFSVAGAGQAHADYFCYTAEVQHTFPSGKTVHDVFAHDSRIFAFTCIKPGTCTYPRCDWDRFSLVPDSSSNRQQRLDDWLKDVFNGRR